MNTFNPCQRDIQDLLVLPENIVPNDISGLDFQLCCVATGNFQYGLHRTIRRNMFERMRDCVGRNIDDESFGIDEQHIQRHICIFHPHRHLLIFDKIKQHAGPFLQSTAIHQTTCARRRCRRQFNSEQMTGFCRFYDQGSGIRRHIRR